jgi:hypothetical protein
MRPYAGDKEVSVVEGAFVSVAPARALSQACIEERGRPSAKETFSCSGAIRAPDKIVVYSGEGGRFAVGQPMPCMIVKCQQTVSAFDFDAGTAALK